MKKGLLFGLLILVMGCSSVEPKEKIDVVVVEEIVNENIDPISKFSYEETYLNEIPETVKFHEKYKGGHPQLLDYVFVRTSAASIRELPNSKSKVIKKVKYRQRLKVLGKVKDYTLVWYKVELPTGEVGYVYGKVVVFRTFKFKEAKEEIVKLENFINEANKNNEKLLVVNSYVPNPNNENMLRKKDKYGVALDQNIRAKYKNQVIHLPDSSIIKLIEKNKRTSKIKASWYPEEYFIVENRNLKSATKLSVGELKKAIIIDATNQNLMLFEKINSEWNVISYVYSKTGDDSKLGFETPKGYYLAPMTKYTMWYNSPVAEDGGTAKFATRFTGGAYLHGTPIGKLEEKYRRSALKAKERNLGTYSGTRKCVRTTEQHAKFIFNWILENQKKTKRNEQEIGENILTIVI
jgi:hypothetical protein